jgi:small subunit ribosomal protein S6
MPRKRARAIPLMTDYELLYIVPASFTDEEVGTVEQAVNTMFAKANVTVTNTTRLGKFRLTYVIKRQTHGHYVLVRFSAEPANVAPLNELLRLSPDKVLRHLIVRMDEVGDDKYQLVQYQEVNVEDRGDRARRPRAARGERGEADTKGQKEGVAALEGDEKSTAASVAPITEEELEKKIDQALEEKA